MFEESLFSKWELNGRFWRATVAPVNNSLELKTLSGKLIFDGKGKGCNAELVGSIDELDANGEVIPLCWHGITTNGILITLLDVVDRDWRHVLNDGLASRTLLNVEIAVIGFHVEPDTSYKSMTLCFPGLSEFNQPGPFFSIQSKDEPHPTTNISVPFGIFKTTVDSFFGEQPLKLDFFYSPRMLMKEGDEIELGVSSGITITPEISQSIDWFFEVMYHIQNMMTTLYCFPTCPSNFFISLDESNTASVYFRSERSNIAENPPGHALLVSMRSFDKDIVIAAVKRWMTLEPKLVDVVERFFRTYYFAHPRHQINLVSYTQVLEVAHRASALPEIEVIEERKKGITDVRNFVETCIENEELRKELIQAISRVGDLTQKQRLSQLLDNLSELEPGLFYESPMAFATCVVNTRNFHTHGGNPNKKTILDDDEQNFAIAGLRFACFLFFWKTLGLYSDKLLERLKSGGHYPYWNMIRDKLLTKEMLDSKIEIQSKGS